MPGVLLGDAWGFPSQAPHMGCSWFPPGQGHPSLALHARQEALKAENCISHHHRLLPPTFYLHVTFWGCGPKHQKASDTLEFWAIENTNTPGHFAILDPFHNLEVVNSHICGTPQFYTTLLTSPVSKPSHLWPYIHKMLLMFISIFFLAFKGWLNAEQELKLEPRVFSIFHCVCEGLQRDTQNSASFQFPERQLKHKLKSWQNKELYLENKVGCMWI